MDVEIIEDEDQIIEISDEEDCKNVLLIDDDEEIPHDVEVVPEENYFPPNKMINIVRAQSLNKTVSNNNCNSGENSAPKTVTENGNNIKQENNSNSQNCPEPKIVSSMNTTVSNSINSGNSKTKRRKRKRNRSQLKNNNNAPNGNVGSAIFEEASCSANNTNLPTRYDVSKLKWLKPLNNLSSPPHLQLVIIDRGHSEWRIPTEKWLMVEKRLLVALNRELLQCHDLSIGLFDGAKWQRGIKIVGCHNENSFNFIMNFIINLDKLWNGAKLDAFPVSYLSRHIVKVYIPPPTIKTELILSLIKLQNPSLNCNDWNVVRECERIYSGGIDIWISVNDQSFMQLRNLRGEIKYGINRIFINPSR